MTTYMVKNEKDGHDVDTEDYILTPNEARLILQQVREELSRGIDE